MKRDVIVLLLYLAGSLCFFVGTAITLVAKLKGNL